MDDAKIGRDIRERAYALMRDKRGLVPSDADLGRAAREVLAKPVATRESVKTMVWAQLPHPLKCPNSQGMIYGGEIEDVIADIVLAALSHFAPPKTMIQGMSVERIAAEMRTERRNFPSEYRWDHDDAARVAHRLANTPVPDPDAEAKRLALEFSMLGSLAKLDPPTADENWNCIGGAHQAFWRAVAAAKKEAGDE